MAFLVLVSFTAINVIELCYHEKSSWVVISDDSQGCTDMLYYCKGVDVLLNGLLKLAVKSLCYCRSNFISCESNMSTSWILFILLWSFLNGRKDKTWRWEKELTVLSLDSRPNSFVGLHIAVPHVCRRFAVKHLMHPCAFPLFIDGCSCIVIHIGPHLPNCVSSCVDSL